MKINPILHPELHELSEAAQNLANSMILNGHQTWELGPLCTRNHADQLRQLKKAVEMHLSITPEPLCSDLHHPKPDQHKYNEPCRVLKRWRATCQQLYSIINDTP